VTLTVTKLIVSLRGNRYCIRKVPIQSSTVFVILVAVKAGGMRIARPRQASGSESKEKNEMTKEEMEEYGSRFVIVSVFNKSI